MGMKRFVPYEKLSKKKQRELNRQNRRDWGAISPVTRIGKNKKLMYDKARRWDMDSITSGLSVFFSYVRVYCSICFPKKPAAV
jgi:hypothetical protein